MADEIEVIVEDPFAGMTDDEKLVAMGAVRVAHMNGPLCINIETWPAGFEPDGEIYIIDDRAIMNGTFDKETDTWTHPPEPVPFYVSDRQLFTVLKERGMVTAAEAKAVVFSGVIPARMQAVIDKLPEDERFAVELRVGGLTQYNRNDPFVHMFASDPDINLTSDEVDQIWRDASAV